MIGAEEAEALAHTWNVSLRAILRALLANGPPGTLNALHAAARARIERNLALKPPPQPSELFAASRKTDPIPTQTLADLLATCRAMVGAGLGFRSLTLFAIVVRATVSLRWSEDGELMQSLAAVDSDISQAIQSCRERLEESDTEVDLSQAQIAATDLKEALVEGERAAQLWGGEFPFIRALANAEALNP